MLEILNRHSHGLVLIPFVDALRENGCLAYMASCERFSATEIAHRFGLNAGYLAVALRMLQTCGWIARAGAEDYRVTPEFQTHALVPADIMTLYAFPFDAYVNGTAKRSLEHWVDLSCRRWDAGEHAFADYLDGVFMIPLLLSLKQHDKLTWPEDHDSSRVALRCTLAGSARDEVLRLLVGMRWVEQKGRSLWLLPAGLAMIERVPITAALASYRRMFAQTRELLSGDPARVFALDRHGHEKHLDRTLNVVGSGFQHQRYFAALSGFVHKCFDDADLAAQPRYLADTGCGDGTLLRSLYEIVKTSTLRGGALDSHPLTLIAIDWNEKALLQSAATLAGVPHLALKGDIGDPASIVADLGRRGIAADEVLHVRSFLDHDRPYLPPADTDEAQRRCGLTGGGVFVDRAGGSIALRDVMQSTVEHLRRWAGVLDRNGLMMLEVHSLDAARGAKFADEAESLHFDAYHSMSRQFLLDARTFVLAAGEAGLFCANGEWESYPRRMQFTRITLNHFLQRPFRVRHARPDECATLAQAQPFWRAAAQWQALAAPSPEHTLVLVRDGHLAAALDWHEPPPADDDRPVRVGLQRAWAFDFQGEHDCAELLQFARHYLLVDKTVAAIDGLDECRGVLDQLRAGATSAWRHVVDEVRVAADTAAFAPELDPRGWEAELADFAFGRVVSWLHDSGVCRQAGERLRVDDLAASLGIVAKYYRYFQSLLVRLQERGWLRCEADGIVVLAGAEAARALPSFEQFERRFAQRHPHAAPFARFMLPCLAQFDDIVTGRVAAAAVMFPDGDMQAFAGIFDGEPIAAFFNRLVAVAANAAAAGARGGERAQPVRIVEIGAGTGGTTLPVLRELDATGGVEYLFTDISPAFLRRARNRFGGAYPFVQYRQLDIERDAAAQGFTPGTHAVAIAANVLHDTRDIVRTLRQTRRLLAPGGVLLLTEYTEVKPWLFFSGALLHGMWLFEDDARRLPQFCLLGAAQWRHALDEAGFTDIEVFALPTQNEAHCGQCVIVCRASEEALPAEIAAADAPEAHVVAAGAAAPGDAAPVSSWLAANVRELILDTLGENRAAAFHGDRPLMQLGLDSVEMVELKGALGRTVGLKLSPAFLFEHETPDKIGAALTQMLSPAQLRALQPAGADAGVAAPAPEAPAERAATPSQMPSFPFDADKAVAVVGIACRLPGAASASALWDLLRDGGDALGSLVDRWQWPANVDPHGSHAGIDRAGLLPRIDAFDADFFQISPREAELMDPQQRLLLELSWEAMERGGYRPAQLATRRTGVFVGACHNDYRDLLARAPAAHDAYVGTGSALSMLANRLSFFYDFHGPSQSIDTACSSSLVALERAVHALRSGECEHALLAAVNLICSPVNSIAYYESGMLSRTGVCRAFDRDADGFVRGEGAVALLLKPLRQALADRDVLHGVILGAAVGHGGRAASLTAPKPASQAAVIEAALRDAGVDADRVQYVETHGTGTQLGDVVELAGLQQAFARRRGAPANADAAHRCGLGSIKTNIGHLEAAAGLAGVVKVLLSMRHAVLPATRNVNIPNPDIDFVEGPFELLTRAKPWTAWRDAAGLLLPRIAGVSSFGFGGVNAHAVLCEAPTIPVAADPSPRREIVVLSARNADRLNARVVALLDDLEQGAGGAGLHDIAWTLQIGREPMDRRLALGVVSIADLRSKLARFLAGAPFDGHAGEVRNVPAGAAAQMQQALARWRDHGDEAPLCRLWTQGHEVDWEALHVGDKPRRVELSAYPFLRERHWIETGADADRPVLRTRHWGSVPAHVETAPARRRHVLLCRPAQTDEAVFLALESRLRDSGISCQTYTIDTANPAEGFERCGWHVLSRLQALFAEAPREEVLLQVAYPESMQTELLRGLSGMLKTAQLEQPQVRTQLVAFEPDAAARWSAQLERCAALRAVDLRFRGGVCQSQDSVALERAGSDLSWRDGATYLITGGAGGLGLVFADEIVRRAPGARVVLAGRSELASDKAARLAEWRRQGLHVDYLRADVSDREQTRALLATIVAQYGSLDGVIHCAGVVRDGYVRNKQQDDYAQVMAAKVRAAVNLDEAIGANALDFFVLFSSAAGVTGNVGQCDYAAANAFLDAYAAQRARRVERGERRGRSLSIAWPWWATEGMTIPAPLREQWIAQGIRPLRPAEGLTAFYAAYASGCAQVDVCSAAQAPVAMVRAAVAPRPVAKAPAANLRDGVRQRLKELLAEVTKLDASRIDAGAALERYGIDSMMVLRLNARLALDFGALSKTLFYEYATLDALGEYLSVQHAEASARWCAVEPAADEAPAAASPSAREAALPHEPIAVIGISGRYAGARDLRAYWDNLRTGRDCIGEIPPERWPLAGFYDPDTEEAAGRGRCYGKWGGFIDGFAEFDAQFFGIAPRDADLMDPQERLFLQTCWEAMEDAAYTRQSLATRHDRRVGVFAGVTKTGFDLYGPNLWQAGKALTLHTSFASMANRVSYVLNLQGPSMPVDTMCSASLVAVHEGCEHLLRGECELAFAGGVNLYLHPSNYLYLGATRMLAPDGRCRAFGADAGGFVPGEGVGAVLLKRLSAAQADGDHIHGVIRATGVNHGGKTNGYTVPNPTAQRELIAATLAKAGVDARAVSYVEAHGTGTALGDPIEITGLTQAFARHTADTQFCAIGSVKPSIGHAESAAGIASLTKVLLQMRHGQLAPSLHAAEPNPNIDFAATPFVVQQSLAPWLRPRVTIDGATREYPRIAGVSSFGAGGTNAHVVVEEYVAPPRVHDEAARGAPVVIVLSARSPQRLGAVAERLLDAIDADGFDDSHLADIAYTLQVGREALEHRLAFVVVSMRELRTRLSGYIAGDDPATGRYAATRPDALFPDADEIAALADRAAAQLAARDYAALCRLWVDGAAVDWSQLARDRSARRMPLPTYPFERTRYWIAEKSAALAPPVSVPRGSTGKPTSIVLRPLGATAYVVTKPVAAAAPVAAPVIAVPVVAAPAVAVPEVVHAQARPAAAVRSAPAAPRVDRSALQAELTRTLAEALFMDAAEIDPRKPFAEMGLDSIIGVEWVRVINRRYELQMVAARIYDHPSVERLTQHLAQQIEQRTAAAQPAVVEAEPVAVAAPPAPEPIAVAAPALTAREPVVREPAPRLATELDTIAIVGMSGRYPQAPDLDAFWRNLAEGRDSVAEIPAWRWDAQSYYDPRPNRAGSIYCTSLGAIDDVDGFDPQFFGISPAEAELMDPQHRLFVQEGWRAFEDAGYDPRSLGDSRCGVYLGIMSNDYATLMQARGMPSDSTGNSAAIAAARISYILDLKGPAISIDTACSSSLVATHLACQALRNGEVDLALAGGVTLYLAPGPYLSMCAAGMLSPQGRCRTLDNSANGFVPGEGVGALLLKRLRDAQADGNPIHGVIVGSGINQDGKTNGITAPSAYRQGELHREVYARYGIDPKTIGYVEMHGTGTQLGDPIELEALLAVYGAAGVAKNTCGLGSVKSNIGHASAAAGVAGVHKVLLQLRHRQLAPTIHYNEPNAHFDFAGSPFYANAALKPWEPVAGRRRAAVSSFGHSGTNAHLVVEEYVAPAVAPFAVTPSQPAVIVLSARTEDRLRAQAQRLLDAIAERALADADLASIAYTLQVGREAMEHRLGCTAGSMQELTQRLTRYVAGEASVDGLYRGEVKRNREALLLFGADEEMQEAAAKWLERGKYAKALEAWVKGMSFDWRRLYPRGAPRSVPLPTYPFANERYWLPPIDPARAPAPLAPVQSAVRDDGAAFVAAAAPPLPAAVTNADAQAERAAFEQQQLSVLYAHLWRMGLFDAPVTPAAADAWRESRGVRPLYARWLDQSLSLLRAADLLADSPQGLVPGAQAPADADAVDAAWQSWCERYRAHADLGAQTGLIEATLAALPQILDGHRLATEIVFPDAGMSRLDGVYDRNTLADYYNGVVAQVAATWIERERRRDPQRRVRVVEIGAGTGGTSRAVFERLRPYAASIAEYAYTDISRSFLMHAQERFGSDVPYLRCELFNVEQPLAGQALTPGGYDIVIAANVLHATRDIGATLRNAKALLGRDGVLVLNEISQFSLYTHLTFGLLDGWWRFEDAALRIPGTPALAPAAWQRAMESVGFRAVQFPAQAAHALGQQVVVGQSGDVAVAARVVPARRSEAAPVDDSRLRQTIAEAIATTLKLPSDRIDTDEPFADYGLDSILGVNAVRLIGERLGIDLRATALFDYRTVAKLAAHIRTAHRLADDMVVAIDDDHADDPPFAAALAPSVDFFTPIQTNIAPAGPPEPIAIVGLSARYPQSADAATLWQHLARGADLLATDANPTQRAGAIADMDRFDALFFNISAVEATYMDPQQRLFLEESWKALEDAGYVGDVIEQYRCGVYVGCTAGDYSLILGDDVPPQAFWGTAGSITPARISYFLDLQGPALAIDTACSSSLVALHVASQALRNGEVDLALAGGVFIQSAPTFQLWGGRAGMLSTSGRCYTFDDRADGFVVGEGVGVLVLKRLSDALAARDHIHGVVRGSGINQDGATNGITAPSALAQERLECAVYDTFGIDPAGIQFIEAHGTGTKLGDPIEFQALTNAFRRYTHERQFCAIGSIKTNLGHTATAAGVAGVIKVLLSLKHGQIPASLHYEQGNSHIDFADSPFYVNTQLRPWDVPAGGVRRAAVSAFGFSGTNAHVVIEQAPVRASMPAARPGHLIVLSARTAVQLREQAQRLQTHLQEHDLDCGNVSYTLLRGRKHFAHRLACVATDVRDLRDMLARWLAGDAGESVYVGETRDKGGRLRAGLAAYGDECIAACTRSALTADAYRHKLGALADLYVQGYALDAEALFDGGGYGRVPLPTYPFAGERYWAPTPDRPKTQPTPAAHQPSMAEHHAATLVPQWIQSDSAATASADGERWVLLAGWNECDDATKAACIAQLPGVRVEWLDERGDDAGERVEHLGWELLQRVQEWLNTRPSRALLVQVVIPAGRETLYALSAALKSARLEQPLLRGQVIGLAPWPSAAELAERLHHSAALAATELRYDGAVAFERSYRRQASGIAAASPWKSGGVYLITGGAGGLGRVFAADIARNAASATVVLCGRSALSESQRHVLRDLGTRVEYRQADVSDAASVDALIAGIVERHGRLDGVLHAAGVINDGFLLKKQQSQYATVLAPKVRGAVQLDRATRALPLDCFVLFSSISGSYGNVGQADYALANAFLDGYAHERAQAVARGECSGRTVSIGWPLWAHGGMQVHASDPRRHGAALMDAPQGVAALYAACAGSEPQLHVLYEALPATDSFVPAAPVVLVETALDETALRERLLARLKSVLGSVTQFSASQLDVSEPLESYGIDSLMITQFNARLGETFENLPKTLLYEYATLAALGDFLLRAQRPACLRWCEWERPPVQSAVPVRAAVAAVARTERVAATAPVAPLQRAIAIIGLAGRYPQARDLDAYWDNLRTGRDCVGEIPTERWSLAGFYEPDMERAIASGRSYGKWGGFVDGCTEFDALFFNISPHEAQMLDPQERLFLQSCWAAMEDAGYTRERFASRHQRRVGVFAGITKTGFDLYGPELWQRGETGVPTTSFSSLVNRVSYVMNLCGPSLPVDTMCSASLTAIHEACEHLLRGECELAFAGGVNLYLHPANYALLSSLRMLSTEGRCHAFGAGGDGFVPGEGVGAVLLKPLAAAQADGDPIHGVIRATGINHGGKTNGYTVPNPAAQRELIAAVLDKAGVDARTVSYIEAHGTGTHLGDPIEIAGLTQAFARHTSDTQFCAIGSVKSNIGHAESAAGIAALTKVLLQMRHRQLVPSLHAQTPNPNIDFAATPFAVQQALTDWARPQVIVDGMAREYPRIAGISSFGAGGANAHVIVEEYVAPIEPAFALAGPAVVVLSARSDDRLKAYAQQLLDAIAARALGDADLPNLAWTLQIGREAMEHRLAFTAGTMHDVAQRLARYVAGDDTIDGLHLGEARRNKEALSVFAEDDELHAAVARWLERGKFDKVLGLWVRGMAFDWQRLYPHGAPRSVSLPTYPFANERHWLPLDGPVRMPAPAAAGDGAPFVAATAPPLPAAVTNADAQAERAAFERHQLQMLYVHLWRMGLFDAPVTPAAADAWRASRGMRPLYARWLERSLALLREADLLADSPQGLVPGAQAPADAAAVDAAWQSWCETYGEHADLGAPTGLIAATLAALPQILDGHRLATEIVFPDAGMSRLEGVYGRNTLADYYNGVVAQVTATWIERELQRDPQRRVRIAEIGAGTGGTSRLVFERLRPYAASIAEYAYTDLSRSFLMHAQERFGSEAPYLRCELFNVEQPPQGQALTPGSYDIVIAANVLHATRDIGATLRNAKALLGRDGLLVLNEISQFSLYTHLTFGLLDGWWRFEDAALRIPGTPALAPAAWQRALESAGFRAVQFPAQAAHALGQQVVVAQSGDVAVAATRPVAARAAPVRRRERTSAGDTQLRRTITAAIAATLKLSPDRVDADEPFADYGLDSILGVNAVRSIADQLGIDLRPTVLFDYRTVAMLAAHIRAEYRLADATDDVADDAVEDAAPVYLSTPIQPYIAPSGLPEPIAIVGLSARYPQSADAAALWQHLARGTDLLDGADAARPGAIADMDRFDAAFFNISGIEATYMDPQQRLFLEESWKALEDAGYVGEAIAQYRCGVYVGCANGDYATLLGADVPPQAFWGNAGSITPARIAYFLDLQGPALAIDTACSSSLVALHVASLALRAGEIDLALAGGVFIQSAPTFELWGGRAGMLSAGGRCYTFDDRADGFVVGEGVGVLVLKRLSDAIAARDHIHGIVRGSGINQDGATNGITAPSALAQERLECAVYDSFGIDPSSIQLVEAHGTGTKLGDPIEFHALTKAFRRYTHERQFCAIGSIKTNMGHTAAAAGAAGVIKVLLAMRHGQMPASLHFEHGNSHIDFDGSPFYVNTQLRPWDRPASGTRRAAVSSFGFSGTNAHVVIDEAPARASLPAVRPGHLVVLSARTAAQLREQAQRLLAHLGENALDCGDIAYTLLCGRRLFAHRLACVAKDATELSALLANWLAGDAGEAVYTGEVREKTGTRARGGLASIGEECIAACAQSALPAGEYRHKLGVLADMVVQGYALDYARLFDDGGYGRVPLPTYPFARQRYWVETPAGGNAVRAAEPVAPRADVGALALTPRWEVLHARADASWPARDARVLVVGATPEHERELRERLPHSVSVAAADAAAHLQAAHDIDHIIWIAPDAAHDSIGDALIADQDHGVLAVFRLVKSLLETGYADRRLGWTVVTRQTQRVLPGDVVEPAHAGVHGLMGTVAKEYPNWRVRSIDLPRDAAGAIVAAFDLPSHADGNSWAYRAGQWYRLRLVPADLRPRRAAYRQDGVYVIVGGAGGLGVVLTEYLQRNYAAQVWWIGRRAHDDAIEAKRQSLAAFGPMPQYLCADATDRDALERACRQIEARHGAIHGVVHAAVAVEDRSLERMDEATFRTSLAAKVDASVQLAQVFAPRGLDFMLFFSSMQSWARSVGQGNYAAGCAFKDAFAQRLAAQAPVKVINWGFWGGAGAASTERYRRLMAVEGFASIAADEGMRVLEDLLSGDATQLAFVRTTRPGALGDLAGASEPAPAAAPRAIDASSDPLEAIAAATIGVLAELTGVAPADIDVDAPFGNYGVDSIISRRLLRELDTRYAVSLPSRVLFDHDSVSALAAVIAQLAPVASGSAEQRVQDALTASIEASLVAPLARAVAEAGDTARLQDALAAFRDGSTSIDAIEALLNEGSAS